MGILLNFIAVRVASGRIRDKSAVSIETWRGSSTFGTSWRQKATKIVRLKEEREKKERTIAALLIAAQLFRGGSFGNFDLAQICRDKLALNEKNSKSSPDGATRPVVAILWQMALSVVGKKCDRWNEQNFVANFGLIKLCDYVWIKNLRANILDQFKNYFGDEKKNDLIVFFEMCNVFRIEKFDL